MIKYLFIVIASCCFLNAAAQTNNAWIQQRIDSLTTAAISIPGIVIGTINKEERKYYYSGVANKSTKIAFDSVTQLEIGSITKTFTAYILSSILQEKKIADTSSIGAYLPDSVSQNKSVSNIRFIELLNHTAGLPRIPDNMGTPSNLLQPYMGYGSSQLFQFLLSYKIDTSHKVNYSNLGVGLAGVLAERISQKSYDQLLKQYITGPAQMKHTGLKAAPNQKISIGYFDETISTYWDMAILQAAGAIKSDVYDMLNYLEFIINKKESSIIKNITTPTATINKRLQVAKGWHILNGANNQVIIWHNGGTYGFSTFCGLHLESGKAVFLAINAYNKNQIADGLGVEILSKMLKEN
ncbi:MAG: serine hydrolase [Sphingobacteriia bacterium]